MRLYALLALWLLPIATFALARLWAPDKLWRLTGVSLGLIASPASIGMYGLYYVGPVPAILGILGLLLWQLHDAPGLYLAAAFGLRQPAAIARGVELAYIETINGLAWAAFYGLVGWLIDRRLKR